MRRIACLLLLAFLSGAAAAAESAYELRLSLYGFSQSRWKADEIQAAVARAAGILGQCGIAVSASRLHILDNPPRFVFSTSAARDLLRSLHPDKPAVFFVEDTANVPAYEAEAIGRANADSRPELSDTVWIVHGAKDLPHVLAHELVHVLSDSGEHSDAPGNLMAEETSPHRTRLAPAQCARARSVGAAGGLLRPMPPGTR